MDLYAENILDHYKHPRHFGHIDCASCRAKGNNPLCGDNVEVFLEIENGIIIDGKFQGEGCAISKASVDILLEELIGKKVNHALSLNKNDVIDLLGIEVSGTRVKCATLGLYAIKESLRKCDEKI